MAGDRDITLRTASPATDIVLRVVGVAAVVASTTIYLAAVPTPNDITLRDPTAQPSAGVVFPTQYAGLRTYYGGAVRELCLVATADANTGMGAAPMVRKGGVTYAVYLVETTDPDATPVRIRTSTGTKAIRIKT